MEESQQSTDRAVLLRGIVKAEDVFSDFTLAKYIGAGSHSLVYRAIWHSAPVAVKIARTASVEKYTDNLDATTTQQATHPFVVATYAWWAAQLSEEWLRGAMASSAYVGCHTGDSSEGSSSSSGAERSISSDNFNSGDGFGSPDGTSVMKVPINSLLSNLKVQPGDWVTVTVMEYAECGSLSAPLANGLFSTLNQPEHVARLRYRALLRTACEVAKGLMHLHMNGYVHGDLKPGNILCASSREDRRGFSVKVADFNLRDISPESNAQLAVGDNLAYAAPEVLNRCVEAASDVYSFGMLLWEMAHAEKAYAGLKPQQVVANVLLKSQRPMWRQGYLPALQDLYLRCTAHDPSSRPPADQLVSCLTALEAEVRARMHRRTSAPTSEVSSDASSVQP
mmetsp:Transcript_12205/g.26245  ORF Transcript_12205/g.26245 Transcript_12205/m.26245 type:complete len:394 (+) Transcript_12205:348-1529(+)|eukprot:CAMPEP_0202890340 /NCGR_PEP_ID=MMETSP1392-20130828/781_1 /ASSEMBLY_ACC=CAM_ASM_000868 /TAXON_ID=225041 /ORGANISM="Chlamydomonas chlamydogama, Strain SAG 11-48b" /LENGTH=393 /DNA_ID=CAMNT_0049573893 /DNA_START=332 /DNA_END=1513 /DNA_ORIENTATION=+